MEQKFRVSEELIGEVYRKEHKCYTTQVSQVILFGCFVFFIYWCVSKLGFQKLMKHAPLLIIGYLIVLVIDVVAFLWQIKKKKEYALLLQNLKVSNLLITEAGVEGTSFESELAEPKRFVVPIAEVVEVAATEAPLNLRIRTKAGTFTCLYLHNAHTAARLLKERLSKAEQNDP